MSGTVSFFVEKKQSPLLHCVCGESSSPTKRSRVVKLKSYKKKRLERNYCKCNIIEHLVLQCETAIRLLPSNKIECPG